MAPQRSAATLVTVASRRPLPKSKLGLEPWPPLPCAPGDSPFRIKGMPYRGLAVMVARAVPGGMDGFCNALDDARLAPFFRQTFLASGRYDVLPLVPLFATLARILKMPFEALVTEASAAQAKYDAKTVFKAMWSTTTVEGIAERIRRFGLQYFDFGEYEGTVPEPNRLVLVHPGVPEYLFPWYSPMHLSYTVTCARGAEPIEIVSATNEATPAGTVRGYPVVTSRTEIRWRAL